MIKQEPTQKTEIESTFKNLLDNYLKVNDICKEYLEGKITFEELTCSLFDMQKSDTILTIKPEK